GRRDGMAGPHGAWTRRRPHLDRAGRPLGLEAAGDGRSETTLRTACLAWPYAALPTWSTMPSDRVFVPPVRSAAALSALAPIFRTAPSCRSSLGAWHAPSLMSRA